MYLVFTRIPGESYRRRLRYIYLWWSLCTLYLHACQVRVTVGDSGLFTSDGVYVPCILHACQVRVTVGDSGLFTSGGVYVPCIYTHAR